MVLVGFLNKNAQEINCNFFLLKFCRKRNVTNAGKLIYVSLSTDDGGDHDDDDDDDDSNYEHIMMMC